MILQMHRLYITLNVVFETPHRRTWRNVRKVYSAQIPYRFA